MGDNKETLRNSICRRHTQSLGVITCDVSVASPSTYEYQLSTVARVVVLRDKNYQQAETASDRDEGKYDVKARVKLNYSFTCQSDDGGVYQRRRIQSKKRFKKHSTRATLNRTPIQGILPPEFFIYHKNMFLSITRRSSENFATRQTTRTPLDAL
jgi:hypothetical protein